MKRVRHFLTLRDLSSDELEHIIKRAIHLKRLVKDNSPYQPFPGKVLGMIFEKSSTRTRVSFETGMIQLGGSAIFLSPRDTQLGRGEPLKDSSIVLSSMVDAIMIRTFEHETLKTFAKYSSVPIINGLCDQYHPCQLLADIMTFVEHQGTLKNKLVCWIGDGNNMCQSYINAASLFDFHLNISCPPGFEPSDKLLINNKHVSLFSSPAEAVKNADLVVTDVWASMGQEEESSARKEAFTKYQVNQSLMQKAKNNALFMHCLPAHRGEEVSADVIDSHQSVVWDEAENRLHAQKALLEFLFLNSGSA